MTVARKEGCGWKWSILYMEVWKQRKEEEEGDTVRFNIGDDFKGCERE